MILLLYRLLPAIPFYRKRLNSLNEEELNRHECYVNSEKGNALPSLKLALKDSGNCHDTHYKEHNGKVKDE